MAQNPHASHPLALLRANRERQRREGAATAPPSSDMNVRRFIRSPRRQARALRMEFRARDSFQIDECFKFQTQKGLIFGLV
jgi:hypothetical protein